MSHHGGVAFDSTDFYDYLSSTIAIFTVEKELRRRRRSAIAPQLWEQIFCVVGIAGICLVIILSMVPMIISSDCITKFKGIQMSNVAGRTLFCLFSLTLCLNLSSCLIFTFVILHDESSTYLFRNQYLPWSFLLYSMGKWSMSTFFVFRYFFVLKTTYSQRAARRKLMVLMLLFTAALGMSGYSNITLWIQPVPLVDLSQIICLKLIRYGINVTMDAILTVFYFRGLIAVIMAQVKVEAASPSAPRIQMSPPADAHMAGEAISNDIDTFDGDIGHRDENNEIDVSPPPSSTSTISCSCPHSKSTSVSSSGKYKVILNSRLIDTVTKSTLLNLIGVTSSCILVGYHGYILISGNLNPLRGAALRSIDELINVFCIFLVFSFASPYYFFLCRSCHFRMRRCSIAVAKRMAFDTATIKSRTI